MTRGQLGAPPSWYPVLRAARYLGVAPWDLARQPAAWLHWALAAEAAELEAARELDERARKRI